MTAASTTVSRISDLRSFHHQTPVLRRSRARVIGPRERVQRPLVGACCSERLWVMDGAAATEMPVREPWMTAGNLCAQVNETHTGIVTLIGDKAFKAKKPIRTDFLDFSTAGLREYACQREVALNR